MKPLEIKKYPHRDLRKKCELVEKITERERELFDRMVFTMQHFCGIGLAAPQVGISQRLIVANVGDEIIKLANPEVIKAKGKDKMSEGCLSIPDVMIDVERAYEIVVRGLNENREILELKLKGLLARVVQHEIDHLNGKLIIDHMKWLEKMKFMMKKR